MEAVISSEMMIISTKLHGVTYQMTIFFTILILFRWIQRTVKSDHVCPSIIMEQLCSHWTNFNEILYLNIFFKSVKIITFD